MSVQTNKSKLTIKGSTDIVTEFFGYSINSILFQRGLYPAESFIPVKKYGLQMMVTSNPDLAKYLTSVLGQLSDWIQTGTVQKLVIVITNIDTAQTVERWVFDIETDKNEVAVSLNKSVAEISKEIQALLRQVTASVSFLPLLDFPCSFDILVYTLTTTNVPNKWEETDAKLIPTEAMNLVKLRSFTTNIHKVETSVAYSMNTTM